MSLFSIVAKPFLITLFVALTSGEYGQSFNGFTNENFGGYDPNRLAGSPNGGYGDSGGYAGGDSDPLALLQEAIPGGGIPGEDYPVLASVPDTGFACDGLIPGYYADTDRESGCQVFHICQEDGRIDSFLCPNGTIFNQQYFVCDWWFNVDCSSAAQFYGLNAEIGKVSQNNGFGYGFSVASTGYRPNTGSLTGGFAEYGSDEFLEDQSVGDPSSSYGAPLVGEGNRDNGFLGGNSIFLGKSRVPSKTYGAPSIGNGNTGNGVFRGNNGFSGNSKGLSSTYEAPSVGNKNRNRPIGGNNGFFGNSRTPSSTYGAPSVGKGNFDNDVYGDNDFSNNGEPSVDTPSSTYGAPSARSGVSRGNNGLLGKGGSSVGIPSQTYGAPSIENGIAANVVNRNAGLLPLSTSSSYGAPLRGNNENAKASRKNGRRSNDNGTGVYQNGNNGQVPSSSYLTPGR